MHRQRVFDATAFFRSGDAEPPRVVITETADAAVVCWQVEPGQRIELHQHPTGQDTWIILSGEGQYFLDAAGGFVPLHPGVVAVAPVGAVHGAVNTGSVPLRFVSVVSPALSGFEPVQAGPAEP
jgi:quercetin dioxygenase-like cupin family protein